uniref:Uncharacterized protein n=3 Tax=Setaria TaxID=4554 RepID=K3YYZ8_SETIT
APSAARAQSLPPTAPPTLLFPFPLPLPRLSQSPPHLVLSGGQATHQITSLGGGMILVAIVAELMEEYMVLVARVLEQLLHGAPFPRRMRFLMLRSLPFAAPPLPPPPPAHALHVATRG